MTTDIKTFKTAVARRLLIWYKRNKRPLPWRETTDPYRIWVSEIMLQQTQVDTVIPYYRRFLDAFPTVEALAKAPLEDVLKVWENLGYYSRARHLHRAAGIVTEKYGGRIPDTREALLKLPGIGAYTAGAILSMAHGQPAPAVDGNLRRVLSRLLAIRKSPDDPEAQKQLQDTAAAIMPARNPGDFNQALMDLGAMVCKAKNPDCPQCPLAEQCLARKLEIQDTLPISAKRPPLPHRQAAAAIIRNRDGCLLVVQRPPTGLLASLWAFPGDFVRSPEQAKEDLRNRLKEDLGVTVRVGKHLAKVDHAYTHFRLTLHAYACTMGGSALHPPDDRAWQWLRPEAFGSLPFSKVDRMIARIVLPSITL